MGRRGRDERGGSLRGEGRDMGNGEVKITWVQERRGVRCGKVC